MITRRFLVSLLISSCSLTCQANQYGVYASAGAAITRFSNTSNVFMTSRMINNYSTDETTSLHPLVGIGIDNTFEQISGKPFDLSLGITAYYANLGQVSGTESPFINGGNFPKLNYHYKVETMSLMLEPRIIYHYHDWQPFVLAGIGPSWNRLYGYKETPTDGSIPLSETFGSHTQATLAYELGLGVQRKLFDDNNHHIHYLGSLDYRYINFGKAKFSPLSAQTTTDSLRMPNLATQALVLSVKASFA